MEFASLRPVIAGMVALGMVAGCGVIPPKAEPVRSAATGASAEPAVSGAVRSEYAHALGAIKSGHDAEAERSLLALSRSNPDLSGPSANLGVLYFRMGKLKDAEEALDKAIKINPRRAAYYNQLGIIYRATGRFNEARRAYEQALQVDPSYANAHLNIGILYDLYLKDLAKALDHYQRYQQLQPQEDKLVMKWIVDLKQRGQTAGKTDKKVSG